MMWLHRGLNDSLLYRPLCTVMAEVDVKDRDVHEIKDTIQGYIFSCIFVQKIPLLLQEKNTEVVKETQTFDQTKSSEQCIQKDRLR